MMQALQSGGLHVKKTLANFEFYMPLTQKKKVKSIFFKGASL